jgi:DNA-binding response OmpR family regulator
MEEVKQILVVDDHFEMLEFLRSMLELSNHEYQVLGVPSAEEGLLELRRTPFDLLITDVRLPGMSGFELARKVKKLREDIPIIMITGYSSEQGKKEASEVGITRYFKKPLDTDALLATVHTTLYGVETVVGVESVAEVVEMELPADVRRRLETLRSDTGARQVMLSTLEGQILYEGGAGGTLALSKLAGYIAESMRSSFLLADQLESPEPFSIQYQAGQKYDLYSANVGLNYFVAIFFDAQARRGRLGTIWVFAQRAINDLQTMLADHRPIIHTVTPPATVPTTSPVQAAIKEEAMTPAASVLIGEATEAVVETLAKIIEPEPVI